MNTVTTKRANFRPLIKNYLLECIADDLDMERDSMLESQMWEHVSYRVSSEYGFMVKRVGLQNAIREWLLGLALPVAYAYSEIEVLLRQWGILKVNSSDRAVEKELGQYWTRLSAIITQEIQKLK